jgi:hypothetical protein
MEAISIGLINCLGSTKVPKPTTSHMQGKINIVLGEIENSIKHEKNKPIKGNE